MVSLDLEGAKSFLENEEYEQAYETAEKSLNLVRNEKGLGASWLGWRRILERPNDAEIEQIIEEASRVREDADIFIVCGIGGSYLGARAVIDALSMFKDYNGPEIVYAGHQMSGAYLEALLRKLDQKKEDGSSQSVYMNVISKSGTTLETALAFRVLREWMNSEYGDDAKIRIICTTSAEGGALNQMIEEEGYSKFVIPDDVGGRFSVLTPVGLLPIAVTGIDIRTLFYGAVDQYRQLEEDPGQVLEYAATRYALYNKGNKIDLFTSFEPHLNSFKGWIQQLLGESEGKENLGMFPAKAEYSTDLHSLGQLVQQGERILMETFLKVENELSGLTVPDTGRNIDGLGYLANRKFHEINEKALEGTRQAHRKGGVPVVTVSLQQLNEEVIGHFIYLYELMTAVYVYCHGVNPFNQPGVEDYKQAMYALLGKQ